MYRFCYLKGIALILAARAQDPVFTAQIEIFSFVKQNQIKWANEASNLERPDVQFLLLAALRNSLRFLNHYEKNGDISVALSS